MSVEAHLRLVHSWDSHVAAYLQPQSNVSQLKRTPLTPGDSQTVKVQGIRVNQLEPGEGIFQEALLEELGQKVCHGRINESRRPGIC